MKQGKNMLTSTLLHKYKLTLVAASVTFLFACAGPDNQTENKQAETPEQATEREVVKSDSVTQTKTTVSRIHIAEQHAIGKANKNPNLKVPDYYIRLHNENYDSKDKKLLFNKVELILTVNNYLHFGGWKICFRPFCTKTSVGWKLISRVR